MIPVDGLLESPAFVVLALTLASAFLLVEVALPTLGIAGACGLGLLVAGAFAVDRQDHAPWLLGLIALAVCLWAILLVRRSGEVVGQTMAAVAYATGAIGHGIVAGDLATVLVGAGSTAVLAGGFPRLLRATAKLMDGPAQVGMEAVVGRTAVVVAWAGPTGTVRLEGTLWNATANLSAGSAPGAALAPGAVVRVDGYEAMLLTVSPVPPPFAAPRPSEDG